MNKIRKVPESWVLIHEMIVPPNGQSVAFMPDTWPVMFSDGETLMEFTASKPYKMRQTAGLVRLYRTKRGRAKFVTTPNVLVKPEWMER